MPLRLALAGAGLAGKRHADAIAGCAGITLAAVADPGDAGRQVAATAGARCYPSLAALFAAEQPDGIILATPNQLHVENGLECVRARCPMLVEKPLAVSAAQAKILADAADAAGVPLAVGHHRRHNPLAQKARKIITAGALGRLRLVHASCWLYKPDEYFDTAPWRRQQGAGPVAVNLVHDVDLIRYLCGAEVIGVMAQAAASARGHENEDAAAAVLRFEGDIIATLSAADAAVAPWSWELTAQENPVYPCTGQSCYWLAGSEGALSMPDLTLWQPDGARSWWQPLKTEVIRYRETDPMVCQIQQFAEVIRGEAPPLVSGEEGIAALRVIEAIHRAAAADRMVYL